MLSYDHRMKRSFCLCDSIYKSFCVSQTKGLHFLVNIFFFFTFGASPRWVVFFFLCKHKNLTQFTFEDRDKKIVYIQCKVILFVWLLQEFDAPFTTIIRSTFNLILFLYDLPYSFRILIFYASICKECYYFFFFFFVLQITIMFTFCLSLVHKNYICKFEKIFLYVLVALCCVWSVL